MKKRILCLILCICMLASTAVLFSSCAKKTIDFANDYSVVYGSDMSEATSQEVDALVQTLNAKTGKDISSKDVKADDDLSDEGKYEILIGNTNRSETQKVLKKIKGNGYAIKAVGKKLVIVGTTNFLTGMAVEHFVNTYISGAESISTVEFEKIEVHDMPMIEITTKTSFVYSSYLLGEGDYPVDGIQRIKSVISDASDVRGNGMSMINDMQSGKSEIVVGVANREETKNLLASMDAENYAVAAVNGKLLITAYNDTVLAKAFDLFANIIKDSIVVGEEEKKQIFVPADFTHIYSIEPQFVTDFPRPEGLVLSGTMDVHDGDMQFYYEGEGVNPAAYEKYCNDLVKAGYELYLQNDDVEGNYFRTYTNQTTNVMLYVAYNAYEHATKQLVEKEKCIRIVSSKLDSANLVPSELLQPQYPSKADRLQNSAITAVSLDYSNDDAGAGQLEIMTLEDGSFIIIDGGNKRDKDIARIYEILKDLFKRGHNYTDPTPSNPIRVAAWYNTHSHGDHIGSTIEFIKQYCSNYDKYAVTIDRLIANFPSDEGYYNCYRDKNSNSTVRDRWAEYSAVIKDISMEPTDPNYESKYAPGMEYIKVRTGQKFFIANVEFEVLFTHEDHYPARINAYNDTCTVIRTNIQHTENGVPTEGENSMTSVMWLGDAYPQSAQFMRAMYGSYLASDIVQMSHHGTGADWKLYGLIKPTCVIIPTKKTSYVSALDKDDSLMYKITYGLSSVQYIIISDLCNYTVSITKNGPNYKTESENRTTGVFSAGDGKEVKRGAVSKTLTTCFLEIKKK